MLSKEIVIAGPCAAESPQQVRASADLIKNQNIAILRASLFKPRTKPGFEGVGEAGIRWLKTITDNGLIVATEVLLPEHVTTIRSQIAETDTQKWLLWIGSRNQNHIIQRGIATRMVEEGFQTFLMVKNQPWENEEHWLGIVEHILASGFPEEKLILCHRGFANTHKSNGFRNPPNFDMAMRIRGKTALPMIFDPSHVGGSVDKVFEATKQALCTDFDGFIVETHPQPERAQTDKGQQLNPEEFKKWVKLVKNQNEE